MSDGISPPVRPKIHCQGLAGGCRVLCCRRLSRRERKRLLAKRVGRKDPPAPRGGRDQKDLAETVKKNPTKSHQGAKTSVKVRC